VSKTLEPRKTHGTLERNNKDCDYGEYRCGASARAVMAQANHAR